VQINFRFRKKNVSACHTDGINACLPVSTTNTNTSSRNWDKWTNCSSCACLCTTASRSFTSSWNSTISERSTKSRWGGKLFINQNNSCYKFTLFMYYCSPKCDNVLLYNTLLSFTDCPDNDWFVDFPIGNRVYSLCKFHLCL